MFGESLQRIRSAFASAQFTEHNFVDENRLGHSRISFNGRVCICAGDTDTHRHAPAQSLSRRFAEL